MIDSQVPLYAVVEFAGDGVRQAPQVTVMFASASDASRYAEDAGLDDVTVAPVRFHLPPVAPVRGDGGRPCTR